MHPDDEEGPKLGDDPLIKMRSTPPKKRPAPDENYRLFEEALAAVGGKPSDLHRRMGLPGDASTTVYGWRTRGRVRSIYRAKLLQVLGREEPRSLADDVTNLQAIVGRLGQPLTLELVKKMK